jgi:hypothetical protein
VSAVNTISTRQFAPARCSSKLVRVIKAANNASSTPFLLAKNRKPQRVMAIRAMADGKREVISVTCPPFTAAETAAMLQWKKGGL